MNNEKLLKQNEVAELLGTTVASMNTLRHKGKLTLPYLRFGNRIRYRKSDIETWINNGIIEPVTNH